MTLKNLFLIPGTIILFLGCLSGCSYKDRQVSSLDAQKTSLTSLEAVAALGQLTPSGEIRRLAPPINGFGGTPRISSILVEEGQKVKKGEILAVFDNKDRILADLDIYTAKTNTLEQKIKRQKREVKRYLYANRNGVASGIEVESKEFELMILEGQLNETVAEINSLKNDLKESELKSPIDGVILRVITRAGERPASSGVVEVGSNQFMEALIEVYESDIDRIKLSQNVVLISENGGFDGKLFGKVINISPQVRQRTVLSTDPTGDADARIVEVRVKLESSSSKLVSKLTGMKVIARFLPK